jgi:carboxyl-terminal processing protease
VREADLLKHLTNEQEKAAAQKKAAEKEKQASPQPTPPGVPDKPSAPLEFGSDKDFQFLQAMNHLKGLPVQTAQAPQSADPKSVQQKKN